MILSVYLRMGWLLVTAMVALCLCITYAAIGVWSERRHKGTMKHTTVSIDVAVKCVFKMVQLNSNVCY